MLPRILEPEVMDSLDEARDYDSMDHANVNRLFVADFLAVWRGTGKVLDVGTGTAQIPLELCKQHPGAEVVAIDLSEYMLALGQSNIERAGLTQRIQVARIDAKAMPYPDGSFAAVISNSIIHHIPEPARVIAEMVRVLQPGGVLFVRDLLRPGTDEEVTRLVRQYAGAANAHQRKMFDDSLHAALTLDEVRGLVGGVGFESGTVQQTSDRHWTWAAGR